MLPRVDLDEFSISNYYQATWDNDESGAINLSDYNDEVDDEVDDDDDIRFENEEHRDGGDDEHGNEPSSASPNQFTARADSESNNLH